MEWTKVFYNGLETNIEVTKCGKVKRVQKNWYSNKSSKVGEIDFEKLKLHPDGYKVIGIKIKGLKTKTVKVHQLVAAAFLDYKFNGNKNVVDHIDSNTLNNKVENLNIVSNRFNTSKERTNKSGLPTGVSWDKNAKKYKAQIYINGKKKHLGLFTEIIKAKNVYEKFLNS